jgi:hypothetical protein
MPSLKHTPTFAWTGPYLITISDKELRYELATFITAVYTGIRKMMNTNGGDSSGSTVPPACVHKTCNNCTSYTLQALIKQEKPITIKSYDFAIAKQLDAPAINQADQ